MLRGLILLLPVLVACRGTSPQTVQLREAMATAGSPAGGAVAFRLPARAGTVRVYDLPALTPVEADVTPGPGTDRPVGLSRDDDLLYTLARTDLNALDLRIGRVRTLDSGVVRAAISPTGTVLLLVGDTLLASAVERRVADVARLPAGTAVTDLWPAPGGRAVLVTPTDSGRILEIRAGESVSARRLPEGLLARTAWGDAVAVASPEGITLLEILRDGRPLTVRMTEDVLALAFSGSGHRLYVATAAPAVVVIERYEGDEIARHDLSAPVTALRADPHGRYVFGRSGEGILAFDGPDGHVHTLTGDWADDLPAAAPDGTVLVRRGDDVVALVPGENAPRGTLDGAGRDHWVVGPWDVRRGARAVAQAGGGGGAQGGGQIYVQVSSTSNAQWAEGLAGDLRLAGMSATVLPPSGADEMYRVVLGPYATREEAEEIGRKLGMPFWIYQHDTTAAAPDATP